MGVERDHAPLGHEVPLPAVDAATLVGVALTSWSCGDPGETMACLVSGIDLDLVLSGLNLDGELVAVVPHRLSSTALAVFGRLWDASTPVADAVGPYSLIAGRPVRDGEPGTITLRLPVLDAPRDYRHLVASLRESLLEIGYLARRQGAAR